MNSDLPFQKLLLDVGNVRQRINQRQIVSALGSCILFAFLCVSACFFYFGRSDLKFLFFFLYVDLWFFNAEFGAGNTGGAQSFFGGATDGLPVREW